jgi:hypothetical protein
LLWILALGLAGSTRSAAQANTPQAGSPPDPAQAAQLAAAVRELQAQVQELRSAVAEVRAEAAQYRAETASLRQELEASRGQQSAEGQPQTPPSQEEAAGTQTASTSSSDATRLSALEENYQLLNSKVDDQYQTKVESASRHRVRLSGLVLLNLFSNRGSADNFDYPNYVPAPTGWDPQGGFGATLRQSQLGLEVFGPRLAGAETSGQISLDFAGGLPNTLNGVNFGVVRLRTASMRLDWQSTSIIAGQDPLFISPLNPSTFASVAVPGFGYDGNLWAWTPQVRVEHRFSTGENQSLTLQAGVLDNLTGEPPFDSFDRIPQAGENSSQPGYGLRTAWTKNVFGHPLTLGAAGYYSRQWWYFNRHVDGWAGMADWDIPLSARWSLSGEFYRGKAVGGLAGGIGRSVIFSGNIFDPNTQIQPINSVGGWSQLKFRLNPKLEFNGAAGLDNPYASDLRAFQGSSTSYFDPTLAQNRAAFVNFIYRPRSNLLFSAEYRHLRTSLIDDGDRAADQVNLIMGILF